jgi:hypothetical protein
MSCRSTISFDAIDLNLLQRPDLVKDYLPDDNLRSQCSDEGQSDARGLPYSTIVGCAAPAGLPMIILECND